MDKEELSDNFKKRIDFYKSIGLITEEEIEKLLSNEEPEPTYIVEWGNGEYVDYELKNDEEALDFWRKHLNDRMQILDMWNYYTGEHLKKPEK